jgi:hypothetical protein
MMLTLSHIALTRYEQRRAAANDDRAAHLIRAEVSLNLGYAYFEFPAIGKDVKSISKYVEMLAGDRPFGSTVIEVPR